MYYSYWNVININCWIKSSKKIKLFRVSLTFYRSHNLTHGLWTKVASFNVWVNIAKIWFHQFTGLLIRDVDFLFSLRLPIFIRDDGLLFHRNPTLNSIRIESAMRCSRQKFSSLTFELRSQSFDYFTWQKTLLRAKFHF